MTLFPEKILSAACIQVKYSGLNKHGDVLEDQLAALCLMHDLGLVEEAAALTLAEKVPGPRRCETAL